MDITSGSCLALHNPDSWPQFLTYILAHKLLILFRVNTLQPIKIAPNIVLHSTHCMRDKQIDKIMSHNFRTMGDQ